MKPKQGTTTMGKAELVQHWLDSAAQDLTVAESLFEKKHKDFHQWLVTQF